jgi:hypothetical protein
VAPFTTPHASAWPRGWVGKEFFSKKALRFKQHPAPVIPQLYLDTHLLLYMEINIINISAK